MKEELVKEEKKEVNEMNTVEKDKKALEEEKKEKTKKEKKEKRNSLYCSFHQSNVMEFSMECLPIMAVQFIRRISGI